MDTFQEKSKRKKTVISYKQAVDSGMALVLMSLILLIFLRMRVFLYLSVIFLVLNMTVPTIFKPFARVWFGFSSILGTVMSKILLSIVLYIVITPIGLIARLAGKDSLQLKKFKKGCDSVFTERNHKYTADDILKPY